MLRFIAYLNRQSKSALMTLGFVLVAVFGYLDYITGSELATEVFYLIPIALVTWFVGRQEGYLISLLCAGAWFVADMLTRPPYSSPLIPYWNVLVCLVSFLVFCHILWGVRSARDRQEELTHFIVHDLQSPVANILGGLGAIEQGEGSRLNEDEKKLIEICLVACRRMLTLITSILDLARLESARMPVNPAACDPRSLVAAAIKNVTFWAQHRRITLAAEIAPDLRDVWADEELTVRILVNLLSNAIKVSPQDTQVTVRAAPSGRDDVAFSVADYGPGIPREWTGKVFEKFGQVDARKAGTHVGFGLGLTFCQSAVEAQGGRISLVSELNQGTTVTFVLPVAKTARQ